MQELIRINYSVFFIKNRIKRENSKEKKINKIFLETQKGYNYTIIIINVTQPKPPTTFCGAEKIVFALS